MATSSSSSQPIAQFSGLASGIDSKSLIDAVITAKLQTNDLRQAQIDFLNSEDDSLAQFKTKLLALNDVVDKFRTANGGGVSKKASSSDATVATAAVSAAALNSSIGIVVSSVASAATSSFTDSYVDGNAKFAANAVGSQAVAVQIGTGANQVTVSENVDSTTTVQGYIDAFNADPNSQGRAVASLVQVGASDQRVVITSIKTGVTDGNIAFVVPGAAGFGGNADLQAQTVQQATNAVFSISGIAGTITRNTNSISDVISGVTFQLAKTGSATIGIGDDPDTTADNFQGVIDAYNDLVSFVNQNNTVTQDTTTADGTNTYGPLAKTQLDEQFLAQFKDALLSANSTTGGSVQSASDLGISTNEDGTITFDQNAFKTGIGNDSEGAGQVLRGFADSTAGVSGFIYQYTEFEGFIDNATTSNTDSISNLNDQIAELQRSADSLRDNLTQQFSNLESVTAGLQQKQSALASAFSSISAK